MENTVEIASVPSRALAALVDYIVLTAGFVLAVRLVPHPDYSFTASFLTSLVYFAIVHSDLTQGQSLGKRAFGLRVVRVDGSGPLYLTPAGAALRYCHFLGWVLLATEIPPLYYRSIGLVASPAALDAHMLFVMSYFFTNIAMLAATPAHRALHDYLSGSLVVRGDGIPDAASIRELLDLAGDRSDGARQRLRMAVAGAVAVAGGLWFFGLTSDARISTIASRRFEIEHRFPVRLVSLSFVSDGLKLEMLRLEAADADPKPLAEEIGRYLLDRGAFTDERLKKMRLTLYSDPAAANSTPDTPPKRVLELELPSLRTVEIFEKEDSPAAASKM